MARWGSSFVGVGRVRSRSGRGRCGSFFLLVVGVEIEILLGEVVVVSGEGPVINFIEEIELIFGVGYLDKFTEHFEEALNKGSPEDGALDGFLM